MFVLQVFLFGVINGALLTLTCNVMGAWLFSAYYSTSFIGFASILTFPNAIRFVFTNIFDRISNIYGKYTSNTYTSLLLIVNLIALVVILCCFFLETLFFNKFCVIVFILIMSFLSAIQSIIIDSYRIKLFAKKLQGSISSSHIMGYKAGSLIVGAGIFLFVDFIKSNYETINIQYIWGIGYSITILFIVIINIFLLIFSNEEILRNKSDIKYVHKYTIKFFINNILENRKLLFFIIFVMFFRIPDAFISKMITIFLIDSQFSLTEIALIEKIFGFFATFIGLMIGGYLSYRLRMYHLLFFSSIIQTLSNIMFIVQSIYGHNNTLLCIVIAVQNISAGIASSSILFYVTVVCKNFNNPIWSYSFIDSLYQLAIIALYTTSGIIATYVSWISFFSISIIFGCIPIIMTILYPGITISLKKQENNNVNTI